MSSFQLLCCTHDKPLRTCALRIRTPSPKGNLQTLWISICRIRFLSFHRLPPTALSSIILEVLTIQNAFSLIHRGSIRPPWPWILALTIEPTHDPDARCLSIKVLLADFHRLTQHVVPIAMSSGALVPT